MYVIAFPPYDVREPSDAANAWLWAYRAYFWREKDAQSGRIVSHVQLGDGPDRIAAIQNVNTFFEESEEPIDERRVRLKGEGYEAHITDAGYDILVDAMRRWNRNLGPGDVKRAVEVLDFWTGQEKLSADDYRKQHIKAVEPEERQA